VKAFGYVRLSKEDSTSTSPQRQRERIEHLCADRGWELVETFSDIDRSAYNGKARPAFSTMMARLGDVDAIVFWRLDRLARSVLDFSRILEETQKAEVQLVSTDQPIDTASAMGKAFVQISSVFAELEAGTLSERARQMMAYKRERGEFVGKVPFGWRKVGKGLEPEPGEQKILRDAARRYVRGQTFSEIARALGFHVQTISRMLQSPRVLEGLPPSVSGPLAQALRERKRDRAGTSAKSLLGGLARCAMCGGPLHAAATRGGRRGKWWSYVCRTPGHVHISAGWLDAHVAEAVIEAVDTGKLIAAIKRRQKLARPRKVSEIEARIELLEDAFYVQGKVPKARFERLRDGLLEALKEAQDHERAAATDLPADLARDLGKTWPKLTVPERRRIVSAVLERVEVRKATDHGTIDPGRVTLVWRG
jgi:DNA invertase Pin-like site-specific DNA recombinase